MANGAAPTVSVCMITYNHEPFIAEAIEGVLMQEADFPVELVIGDDKSTDRTREIVESYAARYPERIKVLARESNLGMSRNFVDTLSQCGGEYVAFCEGDDFWINRKKLAEQIRFLELNDSYSGACSTVRILDDTSGSYSDVEAHKESAHEEVITIDRYLREGLTINTCTFVCRRGVLDLSIFEGNELATDFAMFLLAMDKGPIHFRNVPDAVYRVNDRGVTFTRNWGKFAGLIRDFLIVFDKHTSGRHAASVAKKREYAEMIQGLSGKDWNWMRKILSIAKYAIASRSPSDEVKSLFGTAFPRMMDKAISAKRRLVPVQNS